MWRRLSFGGGQPSEWYFFTSASMYNCQRITTKVEASPKSRSKSFLWFFNDWRGKNNIIHMSRWADSESKHNYIEAQWSIQNSIRHLQQLVRKFASLLRHTLYHTFEDDELLHSVSLPRRVIFALLLQFFYVGVLEERHLGWTQSSSTRKRL